MRVAVELQGYDEASVRLTTDAAIRNGCLCSAAACNWFKKRGSFYNAFAVRQLLDPANQIAVDEMGPKPTRSARDFEGDDR